MASDKQHRSGFEGEGLEKSFPRQYINGTRRVKIVCVPAARKLPSCRTGAFCHWNTGGFSCYTPENGRKGRKEPCAIVLEQSSDSSPSVQHHVSRWPNRWSQKACNQGKEAPHIKLIIYEIQIPAPAVANQIPRKNPQQGKIL